MFESKKRLHSAFSQRSPYFDFENSPQPRHKEYLDFNDIENIIPRKSQSISYSPRHANFNYSENPVFSEMNQCKKSVSCYPAEKSRSHISYINMLKTNLCMNRRRAPILEHVRARARGTSRESSLVSERQT
uniref:Ovule protein n=1 Tax=Heterorhabditis bacteriophora TaxID=37862 RepID=A0A1I7XC93_HETBA